MCRNLKVPCHPFPAPESWSGPARVNISIASSPDALGCPWPWFRWRQIKSEKLWKHVRKVKSWSKWTSRLPDFPGHPWPMDEDHGKVHGDGSKSKANPCNEPCKVHSIAVLAIWRFMAVSGSGTRQMLKLKCCCIHLNSGKMCFLYRRQKCLF